MAWKKRKHRKTKKVQYSISKELKSKGLSDDKFEIMLNNLHLEDIIALKLELSSKNASYYLYGVPIWTSINRIVKEAVFHFAMSRCHSVEDTCAFLGVNKINFIQTRKRYREERNEQENIN